MATGPVKPQPQPLHNFSLPFLRWGGKNQNYTSHRFRRSSAGESSGTADLSEAESGHDARIHSRNGSRTSSNQVAFSSTTADVLAMYSERGASPEGNEVKDGKHEGEDEEGVETAQRTWNLRPRKGLLSKALFDLENGGELQEPEAPLTSPIGTIQPGENPQPKSLRLRGFSKTQSYEKKEKRKLRIALSKEEIEEDIFIITGSKPARKLKKRPKNVQKQLDTVFPGLWLVGASADSYKVADAASKR